MSEYQYYEFAAIDGPISDEGLKYARGCSSRAEVSRVRWRNTYEFGDFRGSVDTLLKYYDAHFYFANWGTVCLGLAFPKGALATEMVQPYLRAGDRFENTVTVKKAGDRSIIYWESNDEGGGVETEGEGVIDELAEIRRELMCGDYRALFLGWLTDFHADEWLETENGAVDVPPIPAGLGQLSPAQEAFIECFPVDRDALAAAAGLSHACKRDPVPLAEVIGKFSASEMRALLARVAVGGGTGVMTELNRLRHPPMQVPAGQTINCKDFAAKAIEAREARLKKEAEAATAKRQREAEKRKQRLASVFERADSLWARLDSLMDQKIASAYDQAATELQELRDAYAQEGENGAFQQKLAGFRSGYSNRPAMLRRIGKL